jgi:hypothetical protein
MLPNETCQTKSTAIDRMPSDGFRAGNPHSVVGLWPVYPVIHTDRRVLENLSGVYMSIPLTGF